MSQETSRSFKMERPSNPPKLRRTSTMDKIKALVLSTYHKDSYMAHRRDWRQGLGHEGRYRRTQSPAPAAEGRRPSWPVPLSPPTIARSVSYAAPSRQIHQQQGTPRLSHTASAGRLSTAPDADAEDADDCQSSASGSQSTEPPSPGLTPSAAGRPCLGGSLNRLHPQTATTAAGTGRPRHHSAGAVGSGGQLSTLTISDVPPSPTTTTTLTTTKTMMMTTGGSLERRQGRPGSRTNGGGEEDVFVTPKRTIPPTALPEEDDPTESDSGEPNDASEDTSSAISARTPAAGIPPPPPPPPPPRPLAESTPIPLSPPPLPSAPAGWCSTRRGSADLLSPNQSSPGIIRRPSLPVTASDRTAAPGVVQSSDAANPASPAVNGTHRASRVAAGLAWTGRHTARELLDPRRLPEATAGRQERWRHHSGSGKDSSGDDSTADLSWSDRLDLTSPALTVTSHQVGIGRRIPLIVTTPVDPAIDSTLSPDFETSIGDSDNSIEAIRQRQSALAATVSRQLSVLREEQRAVDEEAAANAALGAAVAARVEQLARPSEAEQYRASVEQVTIITSLLLGLAGRLARTEAALAALPQHCPEEKALLTSKRDKLSDQLSEARQLEEGVRRRRQQVDACLERYLSRDELADHRHFVQTKAKLIRDAREIEEKIRRGEEQLAALSRAALDTT